MAWIFSISVECGSDKERAQAMARHYDGFISVLANGSEYRCTANVADHDGAYWAICCPSGVTRSGMSNAEDERILTEIGLTLYEHLKTAPKFRYALVGVDVDGFREYGEIDSDLIDIEFSGLVVSDAIWEDLGAPSVFVPFVREYHWRPFTRAR